MSTDHGGIQLTDFRRLSPYVWEVPASFRPDMRVAVRVFASRRLLQAALGDKSLSQAINAATLPGLEGYVCVMPDVHQGYGFPIGGVAATRTADGVVSPGAIGYDINCGVRLLESSIALEEVQDLLPELASAIYAACPSGVGQSGTISLGRSDLQEICLGGSQWAAAHGYASRGDIERTEQRGAIPGADPEVLSRRAIQRGRPQLGTLGSGNHFIEVQVVDQVHDPTAASVMGLEQGSLTVMIHSGSRGFGHQICSDYVKSFQSGIRKYAIELPDRELVCAPTASPEGREYLAAMACAANYAFANRQLLAYQTRQAFESVLPGRTGDWELVQVYDIAHNMGKIEVHQVGDRSIELCVHRKGATRAFGPGFRGLPKEYRAIGQPVLVPGSMGTASWVLLGTAGSMQSSFGSACHGAGRVMSRRKAKRTVWGEELKADLEQRGIAVRAGSMAGLAEEAPLAYKDVDEVVETVSGAGIAAKVARLVPVAVIKG